MNVKHAVLWIDHHAAHVVRLLENEKHETTEVHGTKHHQTHNKRQDDGHRRTLDPEYAERVAEACAGIERILLVGPSTAKDELRHYLEAKHPELAKRIAGVEAADHPTPGELKKHALRFFESADRMLGEHVT